MRVWTTVIGQRLDGAENTRSMLLCAELLRRGHEAVMWTSAYDHIRKEWRREWLASGGQPLHRDDGLEIRFMKGCGYRRNVGPRRFVDHMLAARDFQRQADRMPRPDAIVASVPDHITAAAAVAWGRRHNVATIIDVRDKWPDIFIDHAGNAALATVIRLGLHRERRRARKALHDADALVAMMDSMMDWALASAKRERSWRERVFYLTTTPKNFDVEQPALPAESQVPGLIAQIGDRIAFTFVGTFNRTQHPLLVLDALDRLADADRLDSAKTVFIVGGDGIEADEVRRRAARHPNVLLAGWLVTDEMNALLARSDVGLLPMNVPSPAFNNKAFAYLASGLPIINGATGDLADLIAEHEIGINVKGGDVSEMAEAIAALAASPERVRAMGAAVRALFEARFDRECNYRAYVDHIEKIVAARGQA
jgi:glycosyltransferase involved in cell wall biosynthesis